MDSFNSIRSELLKKYNVDPAKEDKQSKSSSNVGNSAFQSVRDNLRNKYLSGNQNKADPRATLWVDTYNRLTKDASSGAFNTDDLRNRATRLVHTYSPKYGSSAAYQGLVDYLGNLDQIDRSRTASGLLPSEAEALRKQREEYKTQLDEYTAQLPKVDKTAALKEVNDQIRALSKGGIVSDKKKLQELSMQRAALLADEKDATQAELEEKLAAIDAQLNLYDRVDKFQNDRVNPLKTQVGFTTAREDFTANNESRLAQLDSQIAAAENAEIDWTDTNQRKDYDQQLKDLEAQRNDDLGTYLAWYEGLNYEDKERARTGKYNSQKNGAYISISKNDPLDENGNISGVTWHKLTLEGTDTVDPLSERPDAGGKQHWEHMTQDEINAYYYIANTEGMSAAKEFLEDLQLTLDRRYTLAQAEATREQMEENPLGANMLQGVATVGANLVGGPMAFASDVYNAATGQDFNPYSNWHYLQNISGVVRSEAAQDIQETVAGDGESAFWNAMGEVASNAYQAGLSSLDSLAGMATMGSAYTVAMGMGAASSRMRELYESGATDQEIYIGAVGSGIIEALFEKVSLDSLADKFFRANPEKWVKKMLAQAGVEASEEVFTEIANQLLDSVNRGLNSDHSQRVRELMGDAENPMTRAEAEQKATAEDAMDIFWAGFGGFVSGGFSSIGGAVAEGQRQNYIGQQILNQDVQGDILAEAQELRSNDSLANKLTQKQNEGQLTKKDATKLGRLSEQNVADMLKRDTDAVTAAVMDQLKTMDVRNPEATAAAITKRATGDQLTTNDKYYLFVNEKAANMLLDEIASVSKGVTDTNRWVTDIKTLALDQGTFGRGELNTQRASRESMEQTAASAFGEQYGTYVSNAYQPGQNRNNYVAEMERVYQAAKEGKNLDGIATGSTLTEYQKQLAYGLGLSKSDYGFTNQGYATINGETEQVNIVSVASSGNGNVILKTDDGQQVNAENVTFGSYEEAKLYSVIRMMNVGTSTANNIVAMANSSNISLNDFAQGIQSAFFAGRSGVPFADISKDSPAMQLTETERTEAWKAGRQAARERTVKKAQAVQKGKHGKAEGGLHIDKSAKSLANDNRAMNEQQKAGMNAAKVLSGMGLDVTVYASTEADRAENMPNGYYQQSDGSIHIDLNAGSDGEGVMAWALSHEFTHFVADMSPEKFQTLQEVLFAQLGQSGQDVEALIETRMAQLARESRYALTDESTLQAIATEEVVAEMLEPMLTDTDAISQLSNRLKQQDRGLWNRIKDWIQGLVEKLRKAYADLTPNSTIAQQTRNVVAQSEEILNAWVNAAEEAVVDYNLQDGQKNNTPEGVRFSTRTVNGHEIAWIENSGLTVKQLNDHKAVANYIAQHVGEVYTIIESGMKVYLGQELPSEYTHSKYTSYLRRYGKATLNAKNRAVSGLGEMIEIATNRRWESTKHVHSKDAAYGMYRYDSKFAFSVKDQMGNINVRAYDVELLIRNASDGKKYLYDIVNIQKNTADALDLLQRETRSGSKMLPAANGSVSGDNVTQDTQNVNGQNQLFSSRNMDSAYMTAVEQGDTETAQKLVDQAAKDAGYTIAAYHGTNKDFTVFDKGTIGSNFGDISDLGFYFTPYYSDARGYSTNWGKNGARVIKGALKFDNPLVVEDSGWGNAIAQTDIRHEDLFRWAKEGKHDGIIVRSMDEEYMDEDGTPDAVYVAFESNQIKSLDPVSYDNSGNVIPLSQRFDAENADIRYSSRNVQDGQKNNTPEGVRYSLRGVNQDGIEVYETSDEVIALSWKERKARYLEIMQNEYAGKSARFVRNGHVYYAEFDRNSLRKPIFGDRRSDASGVKAIIKAGADGDIFDLVENSQYTRSSVNKKDHTSADYFDYFIKTIQIDGKVFDLIADVEKQYKKDKGYIYTLALRENKKIKASPARSIQDAGKSARNASVNNVTQGTQNVNGQNQLFSSRNVQEISEDNRKMENHFGTTGNYDVAGYILTDGKMLDFSGESVEQSGMSVRDFLSTRKSQEQERNVSVKRYREQRSAEDKAMKAKYEEQYAQVKKTAKEQVKALEQQYSEDTKTFQREFLRLLREYEKQGLRGTKLEEKLRDQLSLAREDAKQAKSAAKENAKIMDQEFRRLLREYETSGRNIDRLEQTVKRQRKAAKDKVDSRRRTEERGKIQRAVNQINKMLMHPTKGQAVPDSLQPAVIQFMEAINSVRMEDSPYAAQIKKYAAELNVLAADPVKNEKRIGELNKSILRLTGQDVKLKNALSAMQEAYAKLENANDGVIRNIYDEEVQTYLADALQKIGETPYSDLSLEQLEALKNAYRAVLAKIRTANKAFSDSRNRSISELSGSVQRELEAMEDKDPLTGKLSKNVEKFSWNNLKPVYAFQRMGPTMSVLYNNLRKGEDTFYRDVSDARSWALENMSKYHYDQWKDSIITYTSTTGKEFSLNLEERMSLYAYSRREQAIKHLMEGGIVLNENTTRTVKNKLGVTTTKVFNDSHAYNLSLETIADIGNSLTAEQRAFAIDMQEYLSTVCAEKNNEVSRALYGVSIAKEKVYWPLKSSALYSEQVRKSKENPGNRQKNAGHMKETVKGANNPVELSGFMETWAGHVNNTAMYHAFTLPMEDMYRVYNWKSSVGEGLEATSIHQLISAKLGNGAVEYVNQFLKDLNGGVRADPRATLASQFTSKFKKGAVSASLSVAIQQPSAVGRAFAILDPKYFSAADLRYYLGGTHTEAAKQRWEDIKKNAPVVGIKEMGRFDIGTGYTTTEFITGSGSTGFLAKLDEISGYLPEKMDQATWMAIYNAAERQVKAETGLTGDALNQKTGELFTEVITKTQVYDSVFSRSGNMRSKDGLMTMATSFMAEPTTTANMFSQALQDWKAGNKKQAGRALASLATATVLNSLLASIVYAARDDDEDKPYKEKYLKSFASEMLDSVNPVGYIPFAKDVWSLFQGYDVDRSDMSVWGDVADSMEKFENAWKALGEADEDDPEAVTAAWGKIRDASLSLTGSVGNLFGIPAKNLIREVNALVNTWQTVSDGREMDSETAKYALWEALQDNLPKILAQSDSKQTELYKAMLSDSKIWINRFRESYDDGKDFQNAVVNALRNGDKRISQAAAELDESNSTTYKKIVNEILAEKHFTKDQVEKAIKAEAGSGRGELSGYQSATIDKFVDLYEDNLLTSEQFTDFWEYKSAKSADGKTLHHKDEIIVYIARMKVNSKAKDALYRMMDYDEKLLSEMPWHSSGQTVWEARVSYPALADLSDSAVSKWLEIRDSSLTADIFAEFWEVKSARDDDGKYLYKKADVLAYIDSLPISTKNKDDLFLAAGFAEKQLRKAPWN